MNKVLEKAWNRYVDLLNTSGLEALQARETALKEEIREWEKPLAHYKAELRQLIARHFADEPHLDREALFQWVFAARLEPKKGDWAGKRPPRKHKEYLPSTNPLPPRLYLKARSYGIPHYDGLWDRIRFQRDGIDALQDRLKALKDVRGQWLNPDKKVKRLVQARGRQSKKALCLLSQKGKRERKC